MMAKPKPVRPGVTGGAADALRRWDATGQSRTKLGRIIGRDTKVLRDIASGAKPYTELGGAIGAAAGGHEQLAGERALAARRTTAAGELARTRGTFRTPAGVVISGSSPAQWSRILAQLVAMNKEQRATLTLTITEGETPSGRTLSVGDPADVTLGGTGGLRKKVATGGKRTNVDDWIDHLIGLVDEGDAGGFDAGSESILGAGGVVHITAHIR